MRKKISDIYSKAFPKKSGEEYTLKELAFVFIGWTAVLLALFVLLKYVLEKFHWDK